MRIGRVDHGGSPRAAVIDGDTVRVLAPEVGTSDLLGADGGERDRLAGRVETEVSLDQAALLAPVEPPTIRDSLTAARARRRRVAPRRGDRHPDQHGRRRSRPARVASGKGRAARPAVGGRMSAVRPPKQRRSRESYERVLDAAHALLEENGFEGFTAQEVAVRSGVSIGAIYERFGSKETLLRAVHERLMESMSEAGALAAARIDSSDGARAAIAASVAGMAPGRRCSHPAPGPTR